MAQTSTAGAILFVELLLLTVLSLSGCNQLEPTRTLKLRGHAMGTSWQLILPRYPRSSDASILRDEIVIKLEQFESQMSHWRDDSLVSQFNRSDSTRPLRITTDLATVIEEAQRVYEITDGAFDITAAPLVNLWGFGPPGRKSSRPTSAQIEDALANVDSAYLRLTQSPSGPYLLSKQHRGVQIDVSSLAKGYAIDLIAEHLNTGQFENYLIEIGGELRARGTNEKGNVWQIGLEQPDTGSIGRVRGTIPLRDLAVATSGSYRNFAHEAKPDGSAYSHIIDPCTGRPVAHNLVSVSVIESTAMRADAWATALMVLGPDKGFQLATEHKIAATFVIDSTSGPFERSTGRFDDSVSTELQRSKN